MTSRTMRTGVRPDGVAVRAPMPRFRNVDDVDTSALWVFLRSQPARGHRVEGRAPLARTPRVTADASSAATTFESLGCASCHRRGARYHASLRAARGRDPVELARWIRNPEQLRPGTVMPTYEALVDEATALPNARSEWSRGPPRSAADLRDLTCVARVGWARFAEVWPTCVGGRQ